MNYNFKNAKFFTTVNDLASLPETASAEIAIVGRSNAGKSSLLNVLTNQNRLAFTSKTPGRTQHLNYFAIDKNEPPHLFLVDLPGYGYAKVPDKTKAHWEKLLVEYLQTREPLIGLVLIMDSRHPLKALDYAMLDFFKVTNKPVHIVLSKADKLNLNEKNRCLNLVKNALKANDYNNCTVQLFSSSKRSGLPELETTLSSWLKPFVN